MFLLDLLLLNIVLFLFMSVWTVQGFRWWVSHSFLSLFIFFNLIWIFLSLSKHFYDGYGYSDSTVLFRSAYKMCLTFFVWTGLFVFFMPFQNTNINYTSLFVFTNILFAILMFVLRIIVLGLRKKYRYKIKPEANLVIAGNKQTIEKIYNSISKEGVHYHILGAFSSSIITPNGHPASQLYKGDLADCIQFIQTKKVEEILCSVKEFTSEEISRLMYEADKQMVRVKLLLDYESILNKEGAISTEFGIPVLVIRREPLEEERNKIIKRTFDIIFSAVVLVLIMSWLTPLLMLIIRLGSKGYPIFVQLRSGKDNKPFKCYKFRSMRVENDDAAKQASKNDSRITKIGAFMRRTNLDELPQFWNVFIGNMSVVGPRPHMLAHTKHYKTLLDNFMVRHLIKPGITGWAQVNGFRGETQNLEDMEARVKYDIEYMEKWSFFLDMKIIFLTIWKTFKGDAKAY